jgi:two-component sensor histidine kinase
MKIIFHLDINDKINFELDRMINIGLILNEIISNSLKYAFDGDKGNISISMKENGDNFELTAKDDGKGLPTGFDEKTDGHLGMQLIYLLGEQLNGTVEVNSNHGTCYKLSFLKGHA